jgi:hypothetical protein
MKGMFQTITLVRLPERVSSCRATMMEMGKNVRFQSRAISIALSRSRSSSIVKLIYLSSPLIFFDTAKLDDQVFTRSTLACPIPLSFPY